MKKKTLTIDEIIAENKTEDNIELKFNIDIELLSNYKNFKLYLRDEHMKYQVTIVAEFEFNNNTYKFYIDRKANAYQLRIYVVNSERYVLQRQYIGNLNPKFLSYFENAIKYAYLFDLDNVNKFGSYEPLFRIKIIGQRFDMSPKEFQDEFNEADVFGNKRVYKEPIEVPHRVTYSEIFSIGLGKKSEKLHSQYFITSNVFILKLALINDYYFGDQKVEKKKKIRKLIKEGNEYKLDKYFAFELKWNLGFDIDKESKNKFTEKKKREYSKKYLNLDEALSDALTLIGECGIYIEGNVER